jgi:copper chaperone
MSETLQLRVTGMSCGGCENAVKGALMQVDGVEEVTASHVEGMVGVTYDSGKVTPSAIKDRISSLGYEVAATP